MLCDYGCGQEAKYQLKNGKWCCCKSFNSCPAIRKKNRESQIIRSDRQKRIDAWVKRRLKGYQAWNKGLTKETDIRVKNYGERNHLNFIKENRNGSFKGKRHTDEAKSKISNKMLGNQNGRLAKGCGRGKKGWYKGFFCDSTYELAYVIYCLDHNIDIKRNTEYFTYEYKGKQHRYYPDFIVNGELIEIKGYHSDLVDIKLKSVNKPIKILYYDNMKYIFDYIYEKYGYKIYKTKNNLYEMYEL